MINRQLVELYMEGDAIGAPYENKPTFEAPRLELAPKPGGTDETDMVRCWLAFLASGQEVTPVNWARFFAKNYRPCGYGKTYPDFFRLVQYLDKRGKLTYAKLLEISEDRCSFGNGCLALVYPLVCYANEHNLNPYQLVRTYTEMTHAHLNALDACALLTSILWGDNEPVVFGYAEITRPEIVRVDAMSTLGIALWCAQKETKAEVIQECLYIGCDTDSTLSLALLLWGVLTGGENVTV